MKLKFLLDANISPETAVFLRSFGFDVKSLIEENLSGIDDAAVARIARRKQRIIITFDLDFGELYYFSSQKEFDVIVLRLDDQRVEMTNAVLMGFLKRHHHVFRKRQKSLVILSEHEVRIVR